MKLYLSILGTLVGGYGIVVVFLTVRDYYLKKQDSLNESFENAKTKDGP